MGTQAVADGRGRPRYPKMKQLAVLLAVLTGATHYGYMPLADEREQQLAFYVMQGVSGAGLLLVILVAIIAWGRPSAWRSAAAGACVLGIVEQSMVAVCGVASYLRPVTPARWQGLCGAHIDVTLAGVMLGVMVAALVAIIAPRSG